MTQNTNPTMTERWDIDAKDGLGFETTEDVDTDKPEVTYMEAVALYYDNNHAVQLGDLGNGASFVKASYIQSAVDFRTDEMTKDYEAQLGVTITD